MMWLDMPPLTALRAFSAFAESETISEAGAKLNVSHAAVSQQLKQLETFLGISLLDRRGRALELTAEGRHLAEALNLGFGAIARAVSELTEIAADRPVHVSTTPSFAGGWLMPRLAGFSAQHPEISLRIDPTPEVVTLSPGGIDLALRYGSGNWPGLQSELLVQSPLVVVAAPELLGDRKVNTAKDLAGLPWIEELGTTEATQWLQEHGVDVADGRRRTQLPGNLMVESARAGQGVLITVRVFVEDDIRSGRLIALFEERPDYGYHIVTGGGVIRPYVRAFMRWLRTARDAAT